MSGRQQALLAPVHDHQPVILEVHEYDEWLAESERPPVHLLRVFPADKMRMKAWIRPYS
jgi:putative SOS response-associated peptidase YedK